MGLKISPEEAMKKLDEVKSHRDQAKQVLTNFRDTNVQMLSLIHISEPTRPY